MQFIPPKKEKRKKFEKKKTWKKCSLGKRRISFFLDTLSPSLFFPIYFDKFFCSNARTKSFLPFPMRALGQNIGFIPRRGERRRRSGYEGLMRRTKQREEEEEENTCSSSSEGGGKREESQFGVFLLFALHGTLSLWSAKKEEEGEWVNTFSPSFSSPRTFFFSIFFFPFLRGGISLLKSDDDRSLEQKLFFFFLCVTYFWNLLAKKVLLPNSDTLSR